MKLPARMEHRFEIGLARIWSLVLVYRPEPFKVNAPDTLNFLPVVTTRGQRSWTFRYPAGVKRSIYDHERRVLVWDRIAPFQYTRTEVWSDWDIAAVWPQHKSIEFWTTGRKS